VSEEKYHRGACKTSNVDEIAITKTQVKLWFAEPGDVTICNPTGGIGAPIEAEGDGWRCFDFECHPLNSPGDVFYRGWRGEIKQGKLMVRWVDEDRDLGPLR
jgi:hypothetical protein